MSMGCAASAEVLDTGCWDDGSSPRKVWTVVDAYLTGRTNSQDARREDLSRTFTEFNVTAEIKG